jgi:hypothetical protein
LNYKKKTLLLIFIATLVRCITAYSIELGNDEVYYRMYAQYLQWNYFDHPPIVGWLIRFTSANLYLDNELFIRIGAIVSAAITTWFIFLSGSKLNNAYTGYLAAVIYTATLYGSIIAGTFILPDSPQMVCWAAGIYLLTDITKYSRVNRKQKRNLLLFGVVAGIGLLCKIHTAFLWLGFLLYIVQHNRQWFKLPVLYLSGFISLLLFYPVIKWNIDNHFVTYLYHSNRVNIAHSGIDISSFLTFTGGQVFYCNPIIFFFIMVAAVAALKNNLPLLTSHKRLLLYCSLPLIILATGISLFKNVLPHWTGPAFYGLILLTACYFSRRKIATGFEKRVMPKPLLAACFFQLLVIVTGIILINFMPGSLGNKKEKLKFGEGDFTLDMYGWRTFKNDFDKLVKTDLLTGTMKKDAVIISNKWFPAAHIDYYVAMPTQRDLIAMGDTNDIHQYAWINNERKKMKPGDDAYCIVPSNNYINAAELYSGIFTTILPPQIIEQKRSGKTCRYFYVWRMKDYIVKPNPRLQ